MIPLCRCITKGQLQTSSFFLLAIFPCTPSGPGTGWSENEKRTYNSTYTFVYTLNCLFQSCNSTALVEGVPTGILSNGKRLNKQVTQCNCTQLQTSGQHTRNLTLLTPVHFHNITVLFTIALRCLSNWEWDNHTLFNTRCWRRCFSFSSISSLRRSSLSLRISIYVHNDTISIL